MIAEVIINRTAKKLNRTFDYQIPKEMEEYIYVGTKVLVPFGRAKKLEEGFDASTITSILELKYLDYLGVMPVIDMCSVCGSKTGIATLSSSRGGYVCKNCLRNENIVSEKTIKLIRMFYYVDISKISSLEISNQSKKEISDFLDDYYDRYTGLYLKSKSLLKNLNKVG